MFCEPALSTMFSTHPSEKKLSVSMRESPLREIEEIAARERKKAREIVDLIMEWSVARLREAGSVNRLLRLGIRLPDGPPRGPRTSRTGR